MNSNDREGEAFLAQLDAALAGREPSGPEADTARFGAALARETKPPVPSDFSETEAAANVRKSLQAADQPLGLITRVDRKLWRYKLGILDIAALVALSLLLFLVIQAYFQKTDRAPNAINTSSVASDDPKDIIQGSEEQWQNDLVEKLEKKISVKFDSTPLDGVIAYISQQTSATIVLDSKQARTLHFTLSVDSIVADALLEWVCEAGKLRHDHKEKSLYISDKFAPDLIQKKYAVHALPFAAELPELFSQTIMPNACADRGWGTSISYKEGALAVTNSREVHAKIARILTRFQNPSTPIRGSTIISSSERTTSNQMTEVQIYNVLDVVGKVNGSAALIERVKQIEPTETWNAAQLTVINEKSGLLIVMHRPEFQLKVKQLLSSLRGSAPAPAPDNANPKKTPDAPLPPLPDAPTENDILARLDHKISVDFVNVPLIDALAQFRAKVAITLMVDSKLSQTGAEKASVTLALKDLDAGTVLKWITRVAKVDFAISDGAIFVTTVDGARKPVKEVYAVRDLDLAASLPDIIIERAMVNEFKGIEGVSATYDNGNLTVVHERAVQDRVKAMLDSLRRNDPEIALSAAKPEPAWKKELAAILKQKIKLNYADTRFLDAIKVFAAKSGVNVVIDPRVLHGTFAISMILDMEADAAMNAVCRMSGLTYTLDEKVLYVQPAPDLAKPQVRIFNLADFAGVYDIGAVCQDMLIKIQPDKWNAAQGTSVDSKGNLVIVRQHPAILDSVSQMIAGLRAALPKNAAPKAIAAGTGTIKGSVKYSAAAPPVKTKKLADNVKAGCTCAEVPVEDLVVDAASKGIQWTIVRVLDVKGVPPLPLPDKAPVISQKGCRFEPHVLLVPPGSSVNFSNPDLIAHNVHTVPLDAVNPPTNRMMNNAALLVKGKSFAEPELILLQCDIHPWMKAFIVVHDPRFAAISDKNGDFEIKGLPPGKYKVHLWQETLGEKNLEIDMKAEQTLDLGEIKFAEK